MKILLSTTIQKIRPRPEVDILIGGGILELELIDLFTIYFRKRFLLIFTPKLSNGRKYWDILNPKLVRQEFFLLDLRLIQY